jgi:hypothetical protein
MGISDDRISTHSWVYTGSVERNFLKSGAKKLCDRPELPARIHDTLDDGEQVERAARQPANARHCHHVAGGEAVEHTEKLAPVGSRACHLLAVDVPAAASGSAKLVKLRVERLPIGADAGVADEVFFGVTFGHILRQM